MLKTLNKKGEKTNQQLSFSFKVAKGKAKQIPKNCAACPDRNDYLNLTKTINIFFSSFSQILDCFQAKCCPIMKSSTLELRNRDTKKKKKRGNSSIIN